MAKVPSISDLQAMTDEELSEVFGFTEQIRQAKKALGELDDLKGKPRAEAEKRIKNMFTPHVSSHEFDWILEDVKRKKSSASMDTASPAEYFD